MLRAVLAHQGQLRAAHDVWAAWNLDPVVLGGLSMAGWAYHRGRARRVARRGADSWRSRCFFLGLGALAAALVSPLDALAGQLAAAHMVQHVLLVLVAAPLLALSAPLTVMVRGAPPALARASRRWRRRLKATPSAVLRQPSAMWMLHVAALWFWHASVPYDAALEDDRLHVVEHTSFLLTGVLFWAVVVRSRGAAPVSYGYRVLLVFTMALQSVFLSALLTFARSPWYRGYAHTTAPWGLGPLADQQLAGVIMWIPAGAVYVTVALILLTAWLRETERGHGTPGGEADDVALSLSRVQLP